MVHQRQAKRMVPLMVALGLCLMCMGQMAFAADASFNAALVVEDVTKCPVKNVPWDPKVFDPSSLGDMAGLLEKAVTPDCYALAANELITCATDNSLMYSSGCCSKACAAGLQKTVTTGCFKQYIKGICGIPDGEKKYGVALFGAAKRCTGFAASCKADLDALAKATGLPTAAANTTKAAASPAPKAAASSAPAAAAAAAPASSPAAAAAAAAAPVASPAPAAKSSAEGLQQLAGAAVLAAVVALAL